LPAFVSRIQIHFSFLTNHVAMPADEYLRSLLSKYQVNVAAARQVAEQQIAPVIRHWAGQHLLDIRLSGSIAKGTANAGANDMDLFIAMRSTTPGGLHDIYESLFAAAARYWPANKQNVSIGIQLAGYHFDLVPGRQQNGYQNYFSLWRNKAQTWTQTNIDLQVQTVAKGIPGFEDCKLDQQSLIPQLRVEVDRDRAAAYGITPGRLNSTLSTLLGGEKRCCCGTVTAIKALSRRANFAEGGETLIEPDEVSAADCGAEKPV
jgi:hypothetical protein